MTREKKRRASFEDISSDTSKLAYKKNRKRQKHIGLKILLGFLCALLVLFGGGLMGVSALMLNDLTTTVIAQDDQSLGISQTEESDIINLAFFGVEKVSDQETLVGPCVGAAIVSVDKGRNTVRVISVTGNTLVEIGEAEQSENDRLSMSYAYGGPVCAIRALNTTFGLDIRDYISVDMDGLEQILAAFGKETDGSVSSISELVLNSASEMTFQAYPHVLTQVLGLTETSLSVGDILRLSTVLADPFTVDRITVPGETVPYETLMQNDVAVILPDKTQAVKTIHDFLYKTPAINSRGAEAEAGIEYVKE